MAGSNLATKYYRVIHIFLNSLNDFIAASILLFEMMISILYVFVQNFSPFFHLMSKQTIDLKFESQVERQCSRHLSSRFSPPFKIA